MYLHPPSSSANRVHPMKNQPPPQSLLQAARRGPALLDAAGTVLVELLDEALELLLRTVERVGERDIELAQHLHALQIALGDLIEVLLHLGREVHVHDVEEVLDELVGRPRRWGRSVGPRAGRTPGPGSSR